MLHGRCTCPLLIRSNSPISPGGAGDGYKGAGRVSGMGLTPGTDWPLSLRGVGGGIMGREGRGRVGKGCMLICGKFMSSR